jgi:SAM-dependent methyltransferase
MDDMDCDFWNDAYREDPDQVMVADQFLSAEIEGLPVGSALDLGCGTGENVLKLAERGWSVVGVDWAAHAIQLATQAAHEGELDAQFTVADITNWEPTRSFDLVLSTYSLPGRERSKRALQTAQKALAPGGTLLVAEWDSSMAEPWGFGEGDLLSPDQIAALLPGLEIEKAEVRRVADAFPSANDPRARAGSWANVAFVRARRPAQKKRTP